MTHKRKKLGRAGKLCLMLTTVIRGSLFPVCASLCLTACAVSWTVHDYCSLMKPVYLQKGESAKLSDATAREILATNETYSKVCGKP